MGEMETIDRIEALETKCARLADSLRAALTMAGDRARILGDQQGLIDEFIYALERGVEMRDLQVEYLRTRSKEALVVSKSAERMFDHLAKAALGSKL